MPEIFDETVPPAYETDRQRPSDVEGAIAKAERTESLADVPASTLKAAFKRLPEGPAKDHAGVEIRKRIDALKETDTYAVA